MDCEVHTARRWLKRKVEQLGGLEYFEKRHIGQICHEYTEAKLYRNIRRLAKGFFPNDPEGIE